jgi:hypothetical protein
VIDSVLNANSPIFGATALLAHPALLACRFLLTLLTGRRVLEHGVQEQRPDQGAACLIFLRSDHTCA